VGTSSLVVVEQAPFKRPVPALGLEQGHRDKQKSGEFQFESYTQGQYGRGKSKFSNKPGKCEPQFGNKPGKCEPQFDNKSIKFESHFQDVPIQHNQSQP